MLRRALAAAALPAFLGSAALLSGCATYASRTSEVRRALERGDVEAAVAEAGKSRPPASRALGLLEKGLVLHYAERWEESNRVFEEAEAEIEDLYTKSLSREAAAFLTSDNILPFHGERFERVFIHYYRALNYIRLGSREDALVECRKVNLKLQAYRDTEGNDEGYPDDAFLQYLTGVLYEWGGETNDAWISYRAAADDYARYQRDYGVSVPGSLAADLLRTSEGGPRRGRDEGEIVVLHEGGFIPHKIETSLNLPILEGERWDDDEEFALVLAERRHGYARDGAKVRYWLRIALPEYAAGDPPVVRARARVDGDGREVETQTVENLGAIARASFDARRGRILTRTIVRGLAKYGLHENQHKRTFFGFLVNLFGAATESADTRSWLLLPAEIAIARIPVIAGTHDVQVLTYDRAGNRVGARTFEDVRVRPGGTAFVHLRTFP